VLRRQVLRAEKGGDGMNSPALEIVLFLPFLIFFLAVSFGGD
jgi:hypothetical protein